MPIILTDGTEFTENERTETMTTRGDLIAALDAEAAGEPEPRDIAVVASELRDAQLAAANVPKLRAELDALLGPKPRARKAGAK